MRLTVALAVMAMMQPATTMAQEWRFSFVGEEAYQQAPRQTAYDPAIGYGWDDPSRFSIKVPEGNYRVTVRFGGDRATATTVKAEDRRLMVDAVPTGRGKRAERSFVVNVRSPAMAVPPESAPGGVAVRLREGEVTGLTWDDRLTLEFLGNPSAVRSVSITRVDVPTLFLLGDSTVADQPAEPAASWGQMLPVLLDAEIAVANHARSGETLKSFLTSLRLDKALASMKPGDWAIIQFGHNDQKRQWPQTYAAADSTFPAYLAAYIHEVRLRGAIPILATSPERRNFDKDGRIKPSHGDYPDAVRKVAAVHSVPLIDLTQSTMTFYEALGPTLADRAFNDEGRDKTHHNAYGALQIARMVAAELIRIDRLGAHIVDKAREYDTARPPHPDTFSLASSGQRSAERPAGD